MISLRATLAPLRTSFYAVLIGGTALVPAARAVDTIVFNTDLGTFTVNGAAASSIQGVTVSPGAVNPVDGSRQFIVHGDLTLNGGFPGGDFLTAVGSRPLDLIVGNNVNIGFNARVDVSAGPGFAGVGGGSAAQPSNFAPGGVGRGFPGVAAAGGHGGFLTTGGNGAAGASGGNGFNAEQGGSGFAAGGTGTGGTGGAGGIGGSATPGGNGGAATGLFSAGLPGQSAPLPGGNGGQGGTGGNGGPGGTISGGGTLLSGGLGGGAGGSGGGGGGGASGAGGGGGGGGSTASLSVETVGRPGGTGGTGGSGGDGGIGGAGGSGGGAIAIHAAGRVFTAGAILAQGSPGRAGEAGAAGQSGSPGAQSLPPNGVSGIGGNGSAGGSGGTGGTGGAGGGGAGGTVLIAATSYFGFFGGGTDTSGGAGGAPNGNPGSVGRTVLGVSTPNGPLFNPFASNTTVVNAPSLAPTAFNPYAGANTPLIASDAQGDQSMMGGAGAYGLLPSNLLTGDSRLASLVANHPAGTTAFLSLTPSGMGPTGFQNDLPGYDILMLANFGDTPMLNPMLMGNPLYTFAFDDMTLFGGSGTAHVLTQLAPGEIYATLVPDFGAGLFQFNDGTGNFSQVLDASMGGGAFFNAAQVPEPASLAIFGLGVFGLGALRRRAQTG